MACPFFAPDSGEEGRLDRVDLVPPRLPLGDAYRGACLARAGDPFRPGEKDLHDLCNCGYARGRCAMFPQDWAADAVRFSVAADRGERIDLIWIVEKNHAPAEHGILEYSVNAGVFIGAHISELLRKQAAAFAESHLRRRVRPASAASG